MSESAVPWNDVGAVYLIAVRTGSFIRPGRINERPNIEYTLYCTLFDGPSYRIGCPLGIFAEADACVLVLGVSGHRLTESGTSPPE